MSLKASSSLLASVCHRLFSASCLLLLYGVAWRYCTYLQHICEHICSWNCISSFFIDLICSLLMTNAYFPPFRAGCLQSAQPEMLLRNLSHHPSKSNDKHSGTWSQWIAEQWICFSLVHWNYIGFVAQSVLTETLPRAEASSFKERPFLPLGSKHLAQSALWAVGRGLREEWSLGPPRCWAWWWLPRGSVCFSSWCSVAQPGFSRWHFSILCKPLGHLK